MWYLISVIKLKLRTLLFSSDRIIYTLHYVCCITCSITKSLVDNYVSWKVCGVRLKKKKIPGKNCRDGIGEFEKSVKIFIQVRGEYPND